ncbi:MAG: hypothetical protein Ct9H300mP25_00580 [Acidobacteriota bacterium]|nr:MAG: hypothetical protein Ct9H300mP25_00580 [Acidobacteriota bacterium]
MVFSTAGQWCRKSTCMGRPGGQATLVDDVIDEHGTPRLSPDGQKVAFSAMSALFRRDLWVYDLSSRRRQQITRDAGDNHSPLWSINESTLTFASSRNGLQRLFQIALPDMDTMAHFLAETCAYPVHGRKMGIA